MSLAPNTFDPEDWLPSMMGRRVHLARRMAVPNLAAAWCDFRTTLRPGWPTVNLTRCAACTRMAARRAEADL